jgi:hypothetical protein
VRRYALGCALPPHPAPSRLWLAARSGSGG